MMKKMTKIAALVAATAFLLAAFPACYSDGDDNKTEQGGGDDTTGGDNTGTGSNENTGTGDNTGTGGGNGGAGDSQKILAVTYDLTGGLPTTITSTDAVISADWQAPTATPATNDVSWTWVATKDRKVKSNNGLQFSNGTSPEEAIKLSAEKNITVKVTYKFAGAYASDKIREIDVGDKVSQMESTTDKETTYDVTCSAAKEVSIKANGVKILKIETAAAN